MSRLPVYGAEIEVSGVMGTFIGADQRSDGQVHFTIKASTRNVNLIVDRARQALAAYQVVNETLVTVVASICVWRGGPAGGLFDEEAQQMLGHTASDLQARQDTSVFEAMLSLRNMAWARSR